MRLVNIDKKLKLQCELNDLKGDLTYYSFGIISINKNDRNSKSIKHCFKKIAKIEKKMKKLKKKLKKKF